MAIPVALTLPLDTLLARRETKLLSHPLLGAVLLPALILACAAFVYDTGGTRNVYVHLMYLPVILAGALFGWRGGLIAGLLGGLAVGPYMPLSTLTGEPQLTFAWIYRTFFFTAIGTLNGSMIEVMHARRRRLEAAADELAATLAASLRTFSGLVEAYDDRTGQHCERVAANARAVGVELGLGEDDLEGLYWAGLLHDVGKIGVPREILLKPGALTHDEYEQVKRHTAYGAAVLASISPAFAGIAEGVRSHHERWDGRGYPDGLRGEGIPLYGRILAVVDAYEAMTSDRPYREALAADEAMGQLWAGSGQQFDPGIIEVFDRVQRSGRLFVEGDRPEPPGFHPATRWVEAGGLPAKFRRRS